MIGVRPSQIQSRGALLVFALGLLISVSLSANDAVPEDMDGMDLGLPHPGDGAMHLLAPALLELVYINSKPPDPAPVAGWDFVDASGALRLPEPGRFHVMVNGRESSVMEVGFKRRPLYAPLAHRDLRIDNRLYLRLENPVKEGDRIEVGNPDGVLPPVSLKFFTVADPLRFNPAIHVNQEGYVPGFSKKAMLGYYLGSLGEMDLSASPGFKLVDATKGTEVFHGPLTPRTDKGYVYGPLPYQHVLEADFTDFTTPGRYCLMVPGLGASAPFAIHDGIAMSFARAYALGLYHQRCGAANELPFTRHTHDACHTALAEVPVPESDFKAAWTSIRSNNGDVSKDPHHTALRLSSEKTQLYPFVRTGKVDVSGGHHDAGDYSKYTINSAQLIHTLMFAVDALPGVASLDNLGIPESGDGVSDLMQEAKWEADFLVKMQDGDGGFYFLVYPRNRKYEDNVLPDHGDTQVVWPKTTSATAAAVAALAQTASSPKFKARYPDEAAHYLRAAKFGWKFLSRAIAVHGKAGAYQKLTHYGDVFQHDDELAWAACELFLATGETDYQRQLMAWYDPASPETRRWGWWRLFEGYGCAARSYAFAVRTGRLKAEQLDAGYLARCNAEIVAAGDDTLSRSLETAYGTPFDSASKRARSAGWFFSTDRAFDLAVAYQLDPKPGYLEAILTAINYEAGCNPVNAVYITGMGLKRQRELVNQYSQNDGRVLPPSGIPIGNIQSGFAYLGPYKRELDSLTFPKDGAATAPYPLYDRWADSFNTTTEPVVVNQGRSLACLAFLAARTPLKDQPWRAVAATLEVSSGNPTANAPVTVTMKVPGLNLGEARIVWEAQGREPAFGGPSWSFTPTGTGTCRVESEAQWPDGRRVFGLIEVKAQ